MPTKHYEVGDWVKIYSNACHIFAGAWVKIVGVEMLTDFVGRYTIEFEGNNYFVYNSDIERHSPSATYKSSYRYGGALRFSNNSVITYQYTSPLGISEEFNKWRDELLRTRYLADWAADFSRMKKERNVMPKIPEIKNVYFNDPCTVVIWEDKTKTIVRCSENDFYDPEKGLAMAIIKKIFGNDNSFHKIFKKWVPEEEPTQDYVKDRFKDIVNSIFSGLAQAGYPLAKADAVKSDENGTVVECHYEEE